MLFWCITWSITLVVIGLGRWLTWRRRQDKPLDAYSYHALIELHRIQRRFQVFQFKIETLRHEHHARRQIAKELDKLRRREHRL